nr:MAG TPA: Mitochondrial import receptor subunit Tom6, fungal [Bacteriophage sp.]
MKHEANLIHPCNYNIVLNVLMFPLGLALFRDYLSALLM